MGIKIYLPSTRCGYPHLAKPGGRSEKYGCTFYLDAQSPIWHEINQAIQAAVLERWGAAPPAGLKMPEFKPGPPEVPNTFCVAAYAHNPPAVANEHGQPEMNKGRIQGGDYVEGWVDVYGYSGEKSGVGVAVGLEGVKFSQEGEHFGGGMTFEEMWGQPAGAPQGYGAPVVPGQAPAGYQNPAPAPAVAPAAYPSQNPAPYPGAAPGAGPGQVAPGYPPQAGYPGTAPAAPAITPPGQNGPLPPGPPAGPWNQ